MVHRWWCSSMSILGVFYGNTRAFKIIKYRINSLSVGFCTTFRHDSNFNGWKTRGYKGRFTNGHCSTLIMAKRRDYSQKWSYCTMLKLSLGDKIVAFAHCVQIKQFLRVGIQVFQVYMLRAFFLWLIAIARLNRLMCNGSTCEIINMLRWAIAAYSKSASESSLTHIKL